ncbi:MAG TPA: VCBS repeat-containing protein [Lacunisphaera sp.]|nr:VCBS repeat-containing protein [Lacunisphaera sp.]
MKISNYATALLAAFLTSGLLLSPAHAQTPTISIDRTVHYTQTDAATVTPVQSKPYSFVFKVGSVGNNPNISQWGPAFYIPGSGGVPQTGASSDTNTGTLNFTASPNNYSDFMFVHDFASNADLESFYPIAPTDGGSYGVNFIGTAPPSPNTFTAGLSFTGGAYPSVTPQITSADNGATWIGGVLHLQSTGTTTLSLNSFPEYGSTTYGSMIATGIFNNSGVIAPASHESYYLPVGDSPGSDPISQPAITSLTLDPSWFVPGQTYTLELQYLVFAGQPDEANLNGIQFQGYAAYRKLVRVSIMIGAATATGAKADFNADGWSDILWHHSSGEVGAWLMNGTTNTGYVHLASESGGWEIIGTGDFNHDGQSDLIWRYAPSGEVGAWLMNGTTNTSYVHLASESDGWVIIGTGDFNHDGQSDLIWRHATSGEVGAWLMNGATNTGYVHLASESGGWTIINN